MAFFDKLDQLAGIDPNSTFGSALNQMTGNVQQPAAQAPVTNAPVAPQAQPVEQAQPQPQMQPAMAAQPMAPVNPTQMGPTQAAAMGQQPANPLNQPVGPMPQAWLLHHKHEQLDPSNLSAQLCSLVEHNLFLQQLHLHRILCINEC